MNELALFTGAGGGLLASRLLGWRTVCAVEIDAYCRRVLMQRQIDGMLDPFPIWDDVRTFDGTAWRGRVGVVSAGFPCQPFSVSGKRQGEDDPRNMWPETIRVIREVEPQFAFLENVPGLLSAPYWGTILGELAESGYDVRWRVLSAAEVGAPHKRDRVWVVAHRAGYRVEPVPERRARSQQAAPDAEWDGPFVADASNNIRRQDRRAVEGGERASEATAPGGQVRQGDGAAGDDGFTEGGQDVPDTQGVGIQGQRTCWISEPCAHEGQGLPVCDSEGCRSPIWPVEPAVGRVVDGLDHRVDRIRALGNGQVPIVAATAWRLLIDADIVVKRE